MSQPSVAEQAAAYIGRDHAMSHHLIDNDLPCYVIDRLEAGSPRAGGGVHQYLFHLACELKPYRAPEQISKLLRHAVRDRGRFVPDREIDQAIRHSVLPSEGAGGNGEPRNRPKASACNFARIEAIAANGCRLADLREKSPFRLNDGALDAEGYLDLLFPGNPLLCCAWFWTDSKTRPREAWRGEAGELQFIVPSPMCALTGRTKDGKESAHTLENTGPRRYAVVELDLVAGDGRPETAMLERLRARSGLAVTDVCAAVLWHLAQFAPLCLVVWSGGKSLHGWFRCLGDDEKDIAEFLDLGIALGGCSSTKCRSQFVRLPEGTRRLKDGTTARQSVCYFNPTLLPS